MLLYVMRSVRLLPLLLLCFLVIQAPLSAQRRPPLDHTLLWKVSGNGLTRPSYIYGTMHIQSEQVFNFSDSVLLKLQECDAFGNEVMIDTLVRVIFQRYFSDQQDDTLLYDGQTSGESEEEPDEEESTFDRIKNYKPRAFREILSRAEKWGEDKPAFLDAYLYRQAKKLNKKIVEIETIEEHTAGLKLDNDGGFDLSLNSGFDFMANLRLYDDMLSYYTSGNLQKLDELMHAALGEREYYDLLTKRNYVMADRIAYHAAHQPTFAALGAGHLPGKEGVIELLRAKGFSVTPVRATYSGLAANYVEPRIQLPWYSLDHLEGAFRIDIPVEPVVLPSDDEDTSGYRWLSLDLGSGIAYSISYYDLPSTGALRDPEALFTESVESLVDEPGERIIRSEAISHGEMIGWEAEVADRSSTSARVRYYLRGNRFYMMMINTTSELIRSEDAERFFQSFTSRDYATAEWREVSLPEHGFLVQLPAEPYVNTDTLYYRGNSRFTSVISRDRFSGQTYMVNSTVYTEYDHFSSIDSFYSQVSSGWVDYGDTLLQEDVISVDGYPGREMLITTAGGTYRYRVRSVLKGDHLYQLWLQVAAGREDSPEVRRFFDSFHLLDRPASGDLFSSKAERLILDISSDDSVRRSSARRGLSSYTFEKEDASALIQAIDREYQYDSHDSVSTRSYLLYALGRTDSQATVRLVRELYDEFEGDIDARSAALNVLISIGDTESLGLMADLLLNEKVENRPAYVYFYPIYGNLRQAAAIYPRILSLLNDSNYRDQILWITLSALDSSVITPADLQHQRDNVVGVCSDLIRTYVRKVEAGTEEDEDDETHRDTYVIGAAARLLGTIAHDDASTLLLQSLLYDRSADIVLGATVSLLKHNWPLPDDALPHLAGDSTIRLQLYRELQELNSLEKFPKEYLKQRYFAESELIEWLSADDYLPSSIKYLSQREVETDGQRGRVFLFKFRSDDDEEWRVGISGPQPIDTERVGLSGKRTGSAYKPLRDMSVRQHFDELLDDAK